MGRKQHATAGAKPHAGRAPLGHSFSLWLALAVPALLAIGLGYYFQRQSTPASLPAARGSGTPSADLVSTLAADLVRAELFARTHADSPHLANAASEAAVSTGRIAKGTSWMVEATLRKVHAAGHNSDAVDAAVRSYGLLALTLHLEAFATQIARELLRSVQRGAGLAHAQSLGRVCGGERVESRPRRR